MRAGGRNLVHLGPTEKKGEKKERKEKKKIEKKSMVFLFSFGCNFIFSFHFFC